MNDKVRKPRRPKAPDRLDETNTNILRQRAAEADGPKPDPKAPSQ